MRIARTGSMRAARRAGIALAAHAIRLSCGGRLRLLALLEAGAVTARILRHLGLPSDVPPARRTRAPPLMNGDEAW